MPFADFREFCACLRTHGELVDIDRPVALELDVAKAMRKSASVAGPALCFKQNGTAFPLVGGVYNSRAKALQAFEATEETVVERILQGLGRRIPPVVVDKAPVHENVVTGDAIDLSKLPVPKYSPDDGGPYITSGIVVSKDPESGVPDLGHYRFEVIDRTTLSFNALPNHRFAKNLARARALGHTSYRAAIVIGVDPLIAYACPIQVPDGTNDFEVAGGLRGAAIELVKAKTVPVEVPARAEFVIEIEVDFTKQVMEGPLGEFTGFYTPAAPQPIARITAITHRNDAIFQALLTGVPPTENHILKQLPYEASLLARLREQFPTLSKVAVPSSGGVAFRIVMAMKPRYAGEARAALLAAMGANMRPKIVIVVDPDIDVHDPVQVDWACAFRMQPARDLIVVDAMPGGTLDPSVDRSLPENRQTGSVMGIDATFPFGAEIRTAGARPIHRDICGPALAERGHEYIEVADIPGWQAFDLPELKAR
jgi:4-hydroxy-3-polyprenylbenzoate decarboxylase/2,5-furandicarboxylate decarboxylase 1